jgi:hypothetical protein
LETNRSDAGRGRRRVALIAGCCAVLAVAGLGYWDWTESPDTGHAARGGLALSQVLTLYTTPVVYLYLDRLQAWLFGTRRAPIEQVGEQPHAVAAE